MGWIWVDGWAETVRRPHPAKAGGLAVTEEKCDSGWRCLSNENGYHYISRRFSQSIALAQRCTRITIDDRERQGHRPQVECHFYRNTRWPLDIGSGAPLIITNPQ